MNHKFKIVSRNLLYYAKNPRYLGKLIRLLPETPHPMEKRKSDIAIGETIIKKTPDDKALGDAVITFFNQKNQADGTK